MTHALIADLLVLIVAAVVSAALIVLLHPLLQRYALARPNTRSSHRAPTPQGAGVAVIGATTLVVAALALAAPPLLHDPLRLAVIFACSIGLAVVGVTDDIRPMEALPRLVLQLIAVGILIVALPAELRIIPLLPWWVERVLLLLGCVWFVNLTNFMDGIDWMTVAEVVPLTAALATFGLLGALPEDATLVSLVLCGAMLGFTPFNKPVARVFLGDVGSLPIGFLLSWLLVLLASRHLTAAALLPLYYAADATVTLLHRLIKGEQITQSHRSHFYQRATDNGFSVMEIVGRVFALNLALAAFAYATLLTQSHLADIAAFAAGCLLVSWLLYRFAQKR